MSSKKEQTLNFRRNGTYVEFPDADKYYVFFIIKRVLSFLVDITIFMTFMFVLIFVFKLQIFLSWVIIYFMSVMYFWTTSLSFDNRTIGHLMVGLSLLRITGHRLKTRRGSKLFMRAMINGFVYTFLPVTAVVIFINILCALVGRTVLPIDYVTKVQIVSLHTARTLPKIIHEWENDNVKNNIEREW